MEINQRSGCPINLSLEVLGDRWSLIVIRDIMFGNRRSFRDLLTKSQEGIASNILSSRLKRLVELGMITKCPDPSHSQKSIYSLTEPSIALVPVLATLGEWGSVYLPTTPELSVRAKLLADGGPKLWKEFMDDLRRLHIDNPIAGANGEKRSPVLDKLTAAYEAQKSNSFSRDNEVSP